MSQVAEQAQQATDGRFWEFENIGELRHSLGGYGRLLDGVLLRKYGKEEGGEAVERPTSEQMEEFERAVLTQRSTIDIAMEHIEDRYKTWWRVIDLYYRQGLSTEAQGWLVLMSRLGMRYNHCPPLVRCTLPRGDEFVDKRLEVAKCRMEAELDCACDFYIFGRMLDYATETLWRAIQRRPEWKP